MDSSTDLVYIQISSYTCFGEHEAVDIEGLYVLGEEHEKHPTWIREDAGDRRIIFFNRLYEISGFDRDTDARGAWCISDMYEGKDCGGYFNFPKATPSESHPIEGLIGHHMNKRLVDTCVCTHIYPRVFVLDVGARESGTLALTCASVAGAVVAEIDVDPEHDLAMIREELENHLSGELRHQRFVLASGRSLTKADEKIPFKTLFATACDASTLDALSNSQEVE